MSNHSDSHLAPSAICGHFRSDHCVGCDACLGCETCSCLPERMHDGTDIVITEDDCVDPNEY